MREWVPFESLAPQEQLFVLLGFGVMALTALVIGFAATALLLRLRNDRRAKRFGRLEAAWEAEVLDVLSGDKPTAAMKTIAPADAVFFVELLARFAKRLSGAERRVLSDLARPYLSHTAKRAATGNAAGRAQAIQSLTLLGMPAYSEVVARGLDDRSDLVAMTSAHALCRPENGAYAVRVLGHLRRFERWDRGFLTSMLARRGSAAAPSLRRLMADRSASLRDRAVATAALQELNDLSSAEIAATMLRVETEPDLVTACLRLIQHAGVPSHLDAVRMHLGSRHDAVRGAAIGALAALESPENLGEVAAALEDSSVWVALQAARGLRDAGELTPLQTAASGGGRRATLAIQVLREAEYR